MQVAPIINLALDTTPKVSRYGKNELDIEQDIPDRIRSSSDFRLPSEAQEAAGFIADTLIWFHGECQLYSE